MRIEDEYGKVHGAGTLITGGYVLTCAHVVDDAARGGSSVVVRVKGRPRAKYVGTVVEECWQPVLEDQCGDVAVLEVVPRVPGAPRARLRRTWQMEQSVRVFGFPRGVDSGQQAKATLAAKDFFGERVQLNAVSEQRVRPGFSGAAVLTESGEVVGMVASVREPQADSSWMIDVQAIRRYAGSVVDTCLTSHPSADRQFTEPAPEVTGTLDDPAHVALTRHLVSWLESGGSGGVCAVGGGATVPLVARLVGLTVPEYRRAAPHRTVAEAPHGTLPQVGRVDAAVDATGKTTSEMAGHLARSLNLPGDTDLADQLEELGSPVVVVMNAVDAAADPYDLFLRLVEPIAVRAPGVGVRLLLGFRAVPPAYLRGAVGSDLTSLSEPPPDTPLVPQQQLAGRLDHLTRLATSVDAAERTTQARYDHVAPRVLGVPEQRIAGATALRIRIQVLRDANSPEILASRAVHAWFTDELHACERMAERALARTRGLRGELDALLGQRDRLRGRLAAYRTRAAAKDLLEAVSEPYEVARGRLYSGLCDLRLAERDVEAYGDAVRRETDRGSG